MKVAIICRKKVKQTPRLKEVLKEQLTQLVKDGADIFYFCGKRNFFEYLCYEAVYDLMKSHYIERVLVRAHYDFIDEDNCSRLIEFSEDERFPASVRSEVIVYYSPLIEIVKMSDVLLTYEPNSVPNVLVKGRAYYSMFIRGAILRKKRIINIFELL